MAGTMVVVGGIFASLTLPAFANSERGPEFAVKTDLAAQSLGVDEEAVANNLPDVKRDGYTATSAADLRRAARAEIRRANLAAYDASGAKALGDDYPWPGELTAVQGGGLSPLRYYYRECVDFVAWRLNRDAGVTQAPFLYTWANLTPGGGSAYAWKRQWEAHGWPVSNIATPGWVAWFPGRNHVAYVTALTPEGLVVIEDYNHNDWAYHQTVIDPADAIYLSPPPR